MVGASRGNNSSSAWSKTSGPLSSPDKHGGPEKGYELGLVGALCVDARRYFSLSVVAHRRKIGASFSVPKRAGILAYTRLVH